ncbi:hypothetical protein QAD02_008295 [Eretmocerus hayati]|uniref:Uncharacterized protein n=1 Tax=Eretmocerus hayati TaxID=131215 RepID=A0ACC2N7E5_9HYME|nr:hypothetical protein QAD02_008295 [Eretmocerus hayati]
MKSEDELTKASKGDYNKRFGCTKTVSSKKVKTQGRTCRRFHCDDEVKAYMHSYGQENHESYHRQDSKKKDFKNTRRRDKNPKLTKKSIIYECDHCPPHKGYQRANRQRVTKGTLHDNERYDPHRQSFSELVLIDQTYGLLDVKWPVSLLAVVDGNDATEIVGVTIIKDGSGEAFDWMMDQMQELHPEASAKFTCFMADEQKAMRTSIKVKFGVPVILCRFHTIQSFERSVKMKDMGITGEEKK